MGSKARSSQRGIKNISKKEKTRMGGKKEGSFLPQDTQNKQTRARWSKERRGRPRREEEQEIVSGGAGWQNHTPEEKEAEITKAII